MPFAELGPTGLRSVQLPRLLRSSRWSKPSRPGTGPLFAGRVVWTSPGSRTLALRPADVDLPAATVTVRRNRVELLESPVAFDADPKTDAGKRTVVIPPHVLPVLVEHRASWAGEDRVFVGRDGSPMRGDAVRQAFTRARNRAGMPGFRLFVRPGAAVPVLPRAPCPGPLAERCRGRRRPAARLAALQPPSPSPTATALPHVTGSPGPGVLRRLRPARPVQLSVRLSRPCGPDARRRREPRTGRFPCSL